MDTEEFQPPFEPEPLNGDDYGCLTRFCVSPTNGRVDWVEAVVTPAHLNKGSPLTDEMRNFVSAGGETNPGDEPAVLIPASLGGPGDDVYNVFLQGRSFDRDVFNNEVESSVYYALKEAGPSARAIITIRFVFKNDLSTRPYKIKYAVELPNGDVLENELVNV